MANTYLYAIASVLAVSAISLIGITTLALKPDTLKKFIMPMVSVAVGAMLGNAFLHLIPEAFEELGVDILVPALIGLGAALFFFVETRLHCRHECAKPHQPHPIGYMSMMADALENFIDGIAIGAAYLVSPAAGMATTIAVLMHEIPTELGDFGVLVHSGFGRWKALAFNLLSALSSVVGAVLALVIGSSLAEFSTYIAPVAAGAFIYIAATGLIPRLLKSRETGWMTKGTFVAIGLAAMYLLTFLE